MEAISTETFARATAPADDPRPMPPALLFFAHPDDETIALGGRLGRFGGAHLVHVTDGVPHREDIAKTHGLSSLNEYRDARLEELRNVLEMAGVAEMSRECLEVPDQEASLQLTWLTRRLLLLLHMYQPNVIFTHPYEGGHPDHDACAFAVHHALELMRFRREPEPLIVEAPFYHAGRKGMETGTFLVAQRETSELRYQLSAEEQERKQALLNAFTTQHDTLRYFPVDEERYRIAPQYEFRRPPHAGDIFYDHHPWGVNSQTFCELAWEADDALEEEMKAACC
jgi:N-acetylglucosamine malate deacetylase 2